MINLKQMSIRRKWRTLVASCCNLPIKHLDPRSSHLKNVRIIIFWHIAVEYNQFMELWMRSDLIVIHLDFDICCVGFQARRNSHLWDYFSLLRLFFTFGIIFHIIFHLWYYFHFWYYFSLLILFFTFEITFHFSALLTFDHKQKQTITVLRLYTLLTS